MTTPECWVICSTEETRTTGYPKRARGNQFHQIISSPEGRQHQNKRPSFVFLLITDRRQSRGGISSSDQMKFKPIPPPPVSYIMSPHPSWVIQSWRVDPKNASHVNNYLLTVKSNSKSFTMQDNSTLKGDLPEGFAVLRVGNENTK